jgi:glycosyltransferase involved in cell wall biosynthesis
MAGPAPPLVSCLMPTADRRRCVPLAIAAFLRQDYSQRELVILDDGRDPVGDLVPPDPRIRYVRTPRARSLGTKRNDACRLARGAVLVHWDDDDWSAPWRLSYQVEQLLSASAGVVGLDRLWFYDPFLERAWQYRYPGPGAWLAGTSLCFRRELWERHPFPDEPVGEDTRWILELPGAGLLAHAREDFLVARVHRGNTSPKRTDEAPWTPVATEVVREMLGQDLADFRAASAPPHPCSPVLVSCILPTHGRRAFVALAVERLLAQDHARVELVVVDDGFSPVEDLLERVPRAQYLRLRERRSIGAKRNLACEVARGDLLVQWDDDDWYGSARLSRQIEPIVADRADLTGVPARWIGSLTEGKFWTLAPELHRRMFLGDVHGGTLAFARSVFTIGARYPDADLAEDAAFLAAALRARRRLLSVENDGLFAYLRHGANSWQFTAGEFLDRAGWRRTSPPPGFDPDLLARYEAAARGE